MTVTPLPFRLRPFGQYDLEQDYQCSNRIATMRHYGWPVIGGFESC
jgi:hypothetical protein